MNLEKYADTITHLFANTSVIVGVTLLSIAWGVASIFHVFNDTQQLLFNLLLSIITLLVAMLIQKSQDKDTRAIHAKLDELINVTNLARDELIGIEREGPKRIEEIRAKGQRDED